MTVEERLMRFKGYFLRAADSMSPEELSGIKGYLDPMDAENFECIYETLTDEERAALDNTGTEVDVMYLVRDLAYNKALYRYWDAVSGRTSFDNDEQVLVLTKDSTLLELGVSYNLFIKTRSIGLYSIGQFIQSLDIKGLYTEEELQSIMLAIKWFEEDGATRLEGIDALPSV